MYRSITTFICSIGLWAMVSPPAHAVETTGNSMVDGACLYMKKNSISTDTAITDDSRINQAVDEGLSVVKGWFKGKSPLCQINSPAGVLVATAEYMDRSVLQTAVSIDALEQAMGVKQTLTTTIRELQRALEGESFDSQLAADRVQTSREIGARAKELEAELDARRDKYMGSEALESHVLEARAALGSARYYHTQTALGLATFRDYITKASDAERQAMVLANQEVGLTSDFVSTAPARFSATITSVFDAMRVGGRISDVLHNDLDRKDKRYIKKKEKESRQAALAVATKADQSTSNSFVLATADPEPANSSDTEQVVAEQPSPETADDSNEPAGCVNNSDEANQVTKTAKQVGKAIGGLFRKKANDPCKNDA